MTPGGRYKPAAGTPAYLVKLDRVLERVRITSSPFVWLATGSREAEAEVWGQVITDVFGHLDTWLDSRPGLPENLLRVVRHGHARMGVDQLVDRRASRRGWTADRMPSNWGHWGRRSGIIRNAAMVEKYPYPDLCVAFFAEISKGTADCAAQAHAAGIPTVSITVEDLYMPHV